MSNIPLTKEIINQILINLHDYANRKDVYNGLPIYDDDAMARMREIFRDTLTSFEP